LWQRCKKLKNFIKYILQKTLGLQNYLYLFARYVILKLPHDKNEKPFLKFLKLVKDGGHVLDIGANLGVMSYYFAKRLPYSTVHAFEPVPLNLDVLIKVKRNLDLSALKVYPYAIGNKKGKVKMVMPVSKRVYFHGLSHIDERNYLKNGSRYEVEIKRLDDLEFFNDLKINAIKIDVEEYEYHVLCGAEKLIIKNRPLIYCELWESQTRLDSLAFIGRLNYRVYVDQEDKLQEFNEQTQCQNFFFIPAEHCDKLKL